MVLSLTEELTVEPVEEEETALNRKQEVRKQEVRKGPRIRLSPQKPSPVLKFTHLPGRQDRAAAPDLWGCPGMCSTPQALPWVLPLQVCGSASSLAHPILAWH